VITTVEVSAEHGPAGSFVVNVSVIVPLVIEGVNVDVSEFAFEKFPLGALHVPLVALPPMLPANVIVPPAQTDCGVPALAIAGAFTVMSTVDVAALQGPEGSFVVNVSVTVPFVIVGVYVEASEFTFEKFPLDALHVALVALPPIVPFNVTVPPGTTVCGLPAFTVAAAFTVI
jgi:hypothetical protein